MTSLCFVLSRGQGPVCTHHCMLTIVEHVCVHARTHRWRISAQVGWRGKHRFDLGVESWAEVGSCFCSLKMSLDSVPDSRLSVCSADISSSPTDISHRSPLRLIDTYFLNKTNPLPTKTRCTEMETQPFGIVAENTIPKDWHASKTGRVFTCVEGVQTETIECWNRRCDVYMAPQEGNTFSQFTLICIMLNTVTAEGQGFSG